MIKTIKEYNELPVLEYKYYNTAGLYKLPGNGGFRSPVFVVYEVLKMEKTIVKRIVQLEDK